MAGIVNNHLSAKERATAFVPELDDHVWEDNYFSGSELEIVAVFDHDSQSFARASRMKRFVMSAILSAILGFCVSQIVIDRRHGLLLLLYMTPAIAYILYEFDQVRRETLPHTAVGIEGVLYINQQRIEYFIPKDNIVDATGGSLKLSKRAFNYQKDVHAICFTWGMIHYVLRISHLTNPCLFDKLISGIKDVDLEVATQEVEIEAPKDAST